MAIYQLTITYQSIYLFGSIFLDSPSTILALGSQFCNSDEFLSCYALFPQIRHVYRHGTINTCERRLEDFKFCMSLKGEEEEEKRRAWIRRKAEWWSGRRVVERSSEDVWEERQ